MMWSLLVYATVVATALAAPSTKYDYVTYETTPVVPEKWSYVAPASQDAALKLSIALKQPLMSDLRARLDRTSNPGSGDFGQHLSRDELSKYQGPNQEAVDAVAEWLQSFDIASIDVRGSAIKFNATAGQANKLLHCKFAKYSSEDGQIMRATEYSIPKGLQQHVDYIYPVSQFITAPKNPSIKESPEQKRQVVSKVPESCSAGVVPQCVAEVYGIDYVPEDASSGSSLAVAGFLEQYPNNNFMKGFLEKYSPRLHTNTSFDSDYKFTVESIHGGNATDQGEGTEALVDTEYTVPFVQPLPVVYYSTGGRGPEIDAEGKNNDAASGNEPWVEFLEALLEKESIPQVLSISYTDTEQAVPRAYAIRVCDLFMQLTARGVSVLAASGDGGASGTRHDECMANDGSKAPKFLPTFPVDCPYVTGVGGTVLSMPPMAASYSSGGFSDVFARPAWQDAAVSSFLKGLGDTHKGWYNASGRAIPDIAAMGSKYLIKAGQFEWKQSGTSMSTPVIASMIALINDKRLRAGKPVLGFLNPILYSEALASVYTDVKEGSGGSCSYNNDFEPGWDAVEGWDPATGLGAPGFRKLMDALFDV